MKIGVLKEIKNHEYRVGLVTSNVKELTKMGHQVFVEANAGKGINIEDVDYQNAGAQVLPTADDVFQTSEMLIKVKELQPVECKKLKPKQIVFSYLHLAPDPEQTKLLLESKAIGIAYETITDASGRTPLLAPMSEIAGRISIQAAAKCLEKVHGGSGVLLAGATGVEAGKVLIIGAGVVGFNAALIAMGMGAEVVILDKSIQRLHELDLYFKKRVKTLYSTTDTIEKYIPWADCIVGAVLIPGAKTPQLIDKNGIKNMKAGSVIVDVAIDQGGCFETAKPTTYSNPTYVVDDVIHYCVSNMPAAVARTSTFALTNVTFPYVCDIANKGLKNALLQNKGFLEGINVFCGKVTYKAIAQALGYDYFSPESMLSE